MGASKQAKALLTSIFVLMVVLLIATTAFAWRGNAVRAASDEKVQQAQLEIKRVAQLSALVSDSETAAFGYIVSADNAFLVNFDAQFTAQIRLAEDLALQVADDANDVLRFKRMLLALKARRNELNVLIQLRQTLGYEAVRSRIVAGTGRALLDQIRQDLNQFQASEQNELARLSALAADDAARLTGYILGCCSLVLLVSGIAFLLYRQDQRLRNESEARLLAAQIRFKTAFDGAPIGMCLVDPKGRLLETNRALRDICGYSELELAAKSFIDLTYSDDVEGGLALVGQLLNGVQDSYTREVRQVHKAGHLIWVRVSVTIVRHQDRGAQYFIVQIEDIGERKRMDEALSRTADLLERTSQLAHIGGWEIDLETMTSTWSREVYLIHEMEPSPTTDTSKVIELFDSPAREQVEQLLKRSIETGEGYDFELPKRTAKGRQIWVHAIGNVTVVNGKSTRLWGTVQDVTSRRERDRVLQALSDRLSLATRSMAMGIWELDLQTQALFWDDTLYAIYGIDPSEGDKTYAMWRMRVHPDDLADVEHQLQQAIELGEHYGGRFRIIDRAQQIRWISASAVIRQDENGIPQQMIGVNRDVTEEVLAELSVEQGRAKLQCVIDAASAFAIIATDLDGTIDLFSIGAEALLGYRADEVVGQCTPERFHITQEVVERGIELSAAFGRPVAGFDVFRTLANAPLEPQARPTYSRSDWTFVRQDGEHIPVSLVVSELYGSGGEVIGYLAIAKDIRAEKADRQAMADARDAAQQANIAKSQFLANMSHEIRTPMNAILGMVQLLQRTELTARQHDYAEKTRKAAESLLGILNDILDFSKVEAGKLTLESAPFDLEPLLRNLSVILSSGVGHRNVELLFTIDPRVPQQLIGDALRFQQVLINLAGNAVKFTQQGQVVLALNVAAISSDMVELQVSVRDSGIGIPPEQLTAIFEGFKQAEASTTRRFGGTGLGLAISQRLVNLMGGRLVVESELGAGSHFHFVVRFGYQAFAGPMTMATLTNRHVLVVDDHADARKALADMVLDMGGQCDTAMDGEEAEAYVHAAAQGVVACDLVLLDSTLPGRDSWQVASALRQLNGGLPIVMLVTAHRREQIADAMRQSPGIISGFVAKPFTANMLQEAILDALANPSGMVEGAVMRERPRRLAGMQLLVVEDNPMNQQVASELLQAEGAMVVVASDGAQGVAQTQRDDLLFDAVLMDIQMPVMDGYTAARLIRAEKSPDELPIIAMTANAMQSDREACAAAGMDDHISKPIDLDTLVTTLSRHVAHAAGKPGLTPISTAKVLAPSRESNSNEGLDVAAALGRLGNDPALYKQLAESFLKGGPITISALLQALSDHDKAAALRHAHTLKGMASTIGACALTECAAALEQQLRQGLAWPDTAMTEQHLADLMGQTGILMGEALSTLEY